MIQLCSSVTCSVPWVCSLYTTINVCKHQCLFSKLAARINCGILIFMVLNQITHVLLWNHTVVYGNVLAVIYSRVSLPANSCPFSFVRARYSVCN